MIKRTRIMQCCTPVVLFLSLVLAGCVTKHTRDDFVPAPVGDVQGDWQGGVNRQIADADTDCDGYASLERDLSSGSVYEGSGQIYITSSGDTCRFEQ